MNGLMQRNKLANKSPKQRCLHITYRDCMLVLENESMVKQTLGLTLAIFIF